VALGVLVVQVQVFSDDQLLWCLGSDGRDAFDGFVGLLGNGDLGLVAQGGELFECFETVVYVGVSLVDD
jgi:hypothetical protein